MFNILKFICLFVGIWMTIVNAPKVIRGHAIPWGNFIIQSAGIAGFIYLQWLM